MDGTTSGEVPSTLADLEADKHLKWWNDYTKRMPGFWNEATYVARLQCKVYLVHN